MKTQDFENIRSKYFPLYFTFIMISLIIMLVTIIVLIFIPLKIEWWVFLILAISAIFLVFLFIILADIVERRYVKKYNNEFQEEVIKPIINNVFKDVDWDKKIPLKLSEITLIGKSHKYKVLNEIHTSEYSIYEVSMLNDFRFRGFVIKKELQTDSKPFIMFNYKYYFKPKVKDQKIQTGVANFDNRYLLYSSDSNFKMDPKLANALSMKLSAFKQVGLAIQNNTVYYVVAYRSSFNAELNLNMPLLDSINDEYIKKMDEFLRKLKSIAIFEIWH